jgi:hypothetical protein
MRRPASLRFERLETRLTPAAMVSFVGGHLRVIGDNLDNLIAIGQSGGQVGVSVTTSGKTVNYGPFAVTGTIYVDGSNGNDTINLSITDTFNGSIGLAGGLGNDSISVAAAGVNSSINGTLRVDANVGNDIVNVVGGANGRLRTADVFIAGAVGTDTVNLQNVDVQGRFIGTGTDSVAIGTDLSRTLIAPTGVSGQVVVNNASEVATGRFVAAGGSRLGSLVYTGAAGADRVELAGAGSEGPAADILGNAVIVLNAGANSVLVSESGISGSLTVTGGSGADSVTFQFGSTVAGAANLVLGDGANVIASDSDVLFAGNLTATLGNGADSVGTVAIPFAATVAGTFQINGGNGDNVVNFDGLLSGGFTYVGGGGNDNVTVTGVYSGRLNASLGAGNDTFTFGSAATRFDGGGILDFGPGDDVYNPPGVPVDWPLTIIGL